MIGYKALSIGVRRAVEGSQATSWVRVWERGTRYSIVEFFVSAERP